MVGLFIADFFLTTGVILGIKIYMKKTGDSFREVCIKIRDAIFHK